MLPDSTDRAGYARSLPDQIASRYDVITEEILVSGVSFSMVVVGDTNRLLDRITPEDFARDERLPYWAEIWTSSLELARLCMESLDLSGKTVLELGCGVGLAGIAAARAGARVIMTDYEEDALLFARCNAVRNLSADITAKQVGTALLDWREASSGDQYDVVIGSDVTYERRQFPHLLRVLQESVATGGIALLTDPDRSVTNDFLSMAREVGFAVETMRTKCVHRGRACTVTWNLLRRSS